MRSLIRLVFLAAIALSSVACQKDDFSNSIVIPEHSEREPKAPSGKGIIPQDIQGIPRVFINTPSGRSVQGIDEKRDYEAGINEWTTDCTIEIHVTTLEGKDSVVYTAKNLNIRGRGNSTWLHYYRKRPYNLKLDKKADFLGTGKTKRWCLMANWMDRTLLRNDVACEAARRTSLEWTPSGVFVDLYIDGDRRGNYWMCEKVKVQDSSFQADYLYNFDISYLPRTNFYSKYGVWRFGKAEGKIPVLLEEPDLDDEPEALAPAEEALHQIEEVLYHGDWSNIIDADSFCDFFLVNELCCNAEPRHPKSTFMYLRDGVLYAGPVWDFDWGTFMPDTYTGQLLHKESIYYNQLLKAPAFRRHLVQRWEKLKPRFQTLDQYIDQRANLIRESEAWNHSTFPCYPNPLCEDQDPVTGLYTGMVNYDEQLTFQEAVDRMKLALNQRIQELDQLLNQL